MVMMSTADKKRRRRRTINWKDGGRRQETTATRDSDERRRRQRIGNDDCGGLRQLQRTAMATDEDGVERQRHARAGDGRRWRGTRPGGEQNGIPNCFVRQSVERIMDSSIGGERSDQEKQMHLPRNFSLSTTFSRKTSLCDVIW